MLVFRAELNHKEEDRLDDENIGQIIKVGEAEGDLEELEDFVDGVDVAVEVVHELADREQGALEADDKGALQHLGLGQPSVRLGSPSTGSRSVR